MGDTDYQLFLIERFGNKITGTRLKPFHYIRCTVLDSRRKAPLYSRKSMFFILFYLSVGAA